MLETTVTPIMAENDVLCAQYETYSAVRFVFILIASLIACFGTAANVFLVYLFSAKKDLSSTPATLYPTVLALLDFAICFEYILLFGVDAIVSYVQIESLFSLYYLYIIPAYVLSRITQLAIPYMLIFATLERLVWTCGNIRNKYLRSIYSHSGRHWTIIVSILSCVLLRLPTAFAMEVGLYPSCIDFFRTMTTRPREWVHESDAYHVFDFHIMTIAQTLIPFLLLFSLNMVIVRKMGREGKQDDEPIRTPTPQKKLIVEDSPITRKISGLSPLKGMTSSVRSAVYTMAAIVTSYLISNTLHLILTIMERSEHPWLIDDEDPLLSSTFHTYFSDMVSFVYMFTSAIRLLIYYGCNPLIRADIQQCVCRSHSQTPIFV